VNAALVLQALFDTNVNLRVQTIATGIHRSTDQGGERRVDEEFATNDDKDSLLTRIAG
jgi:hypothetical protein